MKIVLGVLLFVSMLGHSLVHAGEHPRSTVSASTTETISLPYRVRIHVGLGQWVRGKINLRFSLVKGETERPFSFTALVIDYSRYLIENKFRAKHLVALEYRFSMNLVVDQR